MTITIDSAVAGINIADTEVRFIAKTGIVSASTAVDFNAGSDRGEVIIAGTALGTASGVSMDGNDSVAVTATGEVFAIDGFSGDGIRVNGAGNEIAVSGHVLADDAGIIAFGSATGLAITITETGVVRGGSNGHGDDGGAYSAAIGFAGDGTSIVNNGDIIGEFNPDNGQRIAVLNASVQDANPLGFNISLVADSTFFNTGFVLGDVLLGAGADLYDGRGGGIVNGTLDMGLGDDTVRGGEGAEDASGGGGNDRMFGGDGMDTLNGAHNDDFLAGDDGSDNIFGGAGLDLVFGGAGDDTVSGGTQNDDLRGNNGDDYIGGDRGNDTVTGNAGDDELSGGLHQDFLRGGRGDDRLGGDGGSDTLNGGIGNDTLSGDGGADLYVFDRNFGDDLILGFAAPNREKIDVSGVQRINNFNDLVNNHLTQEGPDAVITVGEHSITLVNVSTASLDAGDFIF